MSTRSTGSVTQRAAASAARNAWITNAGPARRNSSLSNEPKGTRSWSEMTSETSNTLTTTNAAPLQIATAVMKIGSRTLSTLSTSKGNPAAKAESAQTEEL